MAKEMTKYQERRLAASVLFDIVKFMLDKYKTDWPRMSEKERNDLHRKINLFTEVLDYVSGDKHLFGIPEKFKKGE